MSERASRPARARRAQCAHACDARAVHCVLYLVYARHGDARLRSHSLRNRLHHRCPFVPRAGQAHPPAEKPADAALSGRHAAAAPSPGSPVSVVPQRASSCALQHVACNLRSPRLLWRRRPTRDPGVGRRALQDSDRRVPALGAGRRGAACLSALASCCRVYRLFGGGPAALESLKDCLTAHWLGSRACWSYYLRFAQH